MSESLWESEIYSKKKTEREAEAERHGEMDGEGKTMIWDKTGEERAEGKDTSKSQHDHN